MERLVSIPWLDDGEPFFVKGIPINGHREIQRTKAKQAEAITALLNSQQLTVYATAIKAHQLADKQGHEKAREAWIATLKPRGILDKRLDWTEEEFTEELSAFIKDTVHRQLGVETNEAAEAAIEEKSRELRDKWGDAMEAIQSASHDYQLLEAYWLIRASDAKRVTIRGMQPVEFSRSPTGRGEMLELIGDNLTIDHLIALRGEAREPKEDDDHDLVEAEVVRGKSRGTSKSSKKSSGSSTRSSARATATTTESGMSEASSG